MLLILETTVSGGLLVARVTVLGRRQIVAVATSAPWPRFRASSTGPDSRPEATEPSGGHPAGGEKAGALTRRVLADMRARALAPPAVPGRMTAAAPFSDRLREGAG